MKLLIAAMRDGPVPRGKSALEGVPLEVRVQCAINVIQACEDEGHCEEAREFLRKAAPKIDDPELQEAAHQAVDESASHPHDSTGPEE